MKDIIFNGYVFTSLLAAFLTIVFILEKKSVKLIVKIALEMLIIYAFFKGMYLEYNFIILSFLTTIIIATINYFFCFRIKKILKTSFIAQLLENILLYLLVGGFIYFKRKSCTYEELNDINFKFIITIIAFIAVMISSKINYLIINKCDEKKNKTEDVELKKLFLESFEIGKKYIENEIVVASVIYMGIIILSKVFITNLYFDNNLVNEMMSEIVICVCLGMIVNITSTIICSYVYSELNRRKERYKISSDNRINGEKRTLKI